MHGNEEHTPRERRLPLRVRQIPDRRARLFVELRLDHHLLHLAVRERAALVRVKHFHHVQVVVFLRRLDVPRALLLLEAQVRRLHVCGTRRGVLCLLGLWDITGEDILCRLRLLWLRLWHRAHTTWVHASSWLLLLHSLHAWLRLHSLHAWLWLPHTWLHLV